MSELMNPNCSEIARGKDISVKNHAKFRFADRCSGKSPDRRDEIYGKYRAPGFQTAHRHFPTKFRLNEMPGLTNHSGIFIEDIGQIVLIFIFKQGVRSGIMDFKVLVDNSDLKIGWDFDFRNRKTPFPFKPATGVEPRIQICAIRRTQRSAAEQKNQKNKTKIHPDFTIPQTRFKASL
jgi:hypothetical protein